MISEFFLLHRHHSGPSSQQKSFCVESHPLAKRPDAVPWKTCIRQILLLKESQLPSQLDEGDHFFGPQAYQFLLEVVCGLQSPVKGETEVHGQYWKLLESTKSRVSKEFYKLLHQVHVHAKRVRTEHLVGLGSQSYGSYVRKKMKKMDEVNIIGSGHLCVEVLPWLVKLGARVRVHARNPHLKLELQEKFPSIILENLSNLSDVPLSGGLIVAAPVESQQIRSMIVGAPNQIQSILDLRGESEEDPIDVSSRDASSLEIQNLKSVFSEIEASRSHIESKVKKAREMIGSLTEESFLS